MSALELGVAAAPGALRVLVVEDEVLVRMLMAEALRQDGYEVIEAASADEAIDVLLADEPPDILVTDIRMPGAHDGLDLAAAARGACPGLKVLITSAYPPVDGGRGVADGYLAKPFGLFEVVERVRALAAAP